MEKGFRPGVMKPETVRLAAAIAAKESGDARLALKILSKAGELAEEHGLSFINDKEVEEAQDDAEQEIAYEVISTLPEHQKLVLYAVAMLSLQGSRYKKLVDGDDTLIFSGEVYNKYTKLAEAMHKDSKSSRWYRKYVSDLEMQGLIITYESGKGVRGHTKLIKLAYPAAKIKDTIEKSLFMESEAKGDVSAVA